MSLVEHAKRELNLLKEKERKDGTFGKMEQDLHDNTLKIVKKFCEIGHSGTSAEWQIQVLKTLLQHKPLTGLTGKPDEWMETVDKKLYQNKRDSRVFKAKNDPRAFFIDTDGSRKFIKFPCTLDW